MSVPDKTTFDPEKINISDFKIILEQIKTPEAFDSSKLEGYEVNNSLQLSFNVEDKLAKGLYKITVVTNSKGHNEEEASCDFSFLFIFGIENMEALAFKKENNEIEVSQDLAYALSSITYSTSRGILLSRLRRTVMQGFVLPIMDPKKLLYVEDA